MKGINKITFLPLTGIFIASCNSLKLSDYYYPIKDSSSKVYLYVNPYNPEFNEYWKVTSNQNKQTLLTESYDAKFKLYNTFKEKLTRENYKLIEYSEYESKATNTNEEIKSRIRENDVFGYNKENKYKYVVEYTNSFGKFQFTKERSYLGTETIHVQNKIYKTAKFSDKYFIARLDQYDFYEFEQTTYYAKGIGMIKYIRYLPNEERVLELQKVINEEEFTNMMIKSSR